MYIIIIFRLFCFAHTRSLIACVMCVRTQLGLNTIFTLCYATYTNGLLHAIVCVRALRKYNKKKRCRR